MSRVFLDTNVLAYQFDHSDPRKRQAAMGVVQRQEHTFVISTQVMLELFVVLTRKLRPPLPHDDAAEVIDLLTQLEVVSTDDSLVRRAVTTVDEHQVSLWDAMIIEAAAEARCDEIWTEDLATGASLRGVDIVNPLP